MCTFPSPFPSHCRLCLGNNDWPRARLPVLFSDWFFPCECNACSNRAWLARGTHVCKSWPGMSAAHSASFRRMSSSCNKIESRLTHILDDIRIIRLNGVSSGHCNEPSGSDRAGEMYSTALREGPSYLEVRGFLWILQQIFGFLKRPWAYWLTERILVSQKNILLHGIWCSCH
jgi:hypothetical protein